jgi:catechol O-methyltransferase
MMQDTLDYVLSNAEKGKPVSVLETIDKFALETGKFLMNVGPEKGKILQSSLQKHNPKTVLELGSFIGYSAILIASTIDDDAMLYSVDPDQNSIEISQKMVDFAGLSNKVNFINSKAETAIPTFKNILDFVFIDHVKKKYFSDLILLENTNLLSSKSVVFADNVGLFADSMEDYFNHVRNSGIYNSENIGAHLEYRDNIYDAVEISIMK